MKHERTDIDTLRSRIAEINYDGSADTPRDRIARRLRDAIGELHADVARIELWASALTSFAEPIPDYSPSKTLVFNRARVRASKEPATATEIPAEQE